jgi:hypothetical protein
LFFSRDAFIEEFLAMHNKCKKRYCDCVWNWKCGLISILIAGLLAAWTGQHALGSGSQRESIEKDVRIMPGKLLAEGRNTTPVGPYGLLTYRLEEVTLPASDNTETARSRGAMKDALRLTITGKSLLTVTRVWIGDFLLPSVWSHGPSKIGALIYNQSMLVEGADISIVDDRDETHSLPERLRLPDSFRTTIKHEAIEEGNGIVGIRSVLRIAGAERQRFVAIEMKTAKPLPITNIGYSVQIGRRFFDAGGGHTNWSVQLTERQFAELKDGDRVAIGVGAFNIAYLGRLNKSIMDR